MSFKFVPQAPAGALNFRRFVYNNKAEIREQEPAKIVFVENNCYYTDFIRFIDLTFLFENVEFDNPFMNFSMCGQHIICEDYEYNETISKILFTNNEPMPYEFLRSLLIADGIIENSNHKAIENDIYGYKMYMQGKKVILDGEALKDCRLIVKGVE